MPSYACAHTSLYTIATPYLFMKQFTSLWPDKPSERNLPLENIVIITDSSPKHSIFVSARTFVVVCPFRKNFD